MFASPSPSTGAETGRDGGNVPLEEVTIANVPDILSCVSRHQNDSLSSPQLHANVNTNA